MRSSRDSAVHLHCRGESLGPEERNLAWRAADVLRRATGVRDGVEIHLQKRIPAGAGLGGGSSDAAAVLLALNRLWRTGLTPRRLTNLAAQLGADVPFFLTGRPAVMRGIGDRVTPLDRFPTAQLVVVWPRFEVSTAWAYRQFDLAPTPPLPPLRISALKRGGYGLADLLHNDLQGVAVSAHPKLEAIARALRAAGATGDLMTGSGSAMFGLFPSQRRATLAARELRRRGYWAVAVHTLDALPPMRWQRR